VTPHRVPKSLPFDSVPIHTNCVHAFVTYFCSILILSSQLCLGLPLWFYAVVSSMRTAHLLCFVLLDLIPPSVSHVGFFLFATASGPALGPTQPPIKWVPWALLGVKRPGCEADHSPPSSAEVKECVALYLHSPNTPSWHGAHLKHRDTFTFIGIT
jgi:hypothetical protein